MISEKMKVFVEGSSVIRAMFEEGKKMAAIYGAENVYDFSLGNPNVPAPKEVNQAIIDVIKRNGGADGRGTLNLNVQNDPKCYQSRTILPGVL